MSELSSNVIEIPLFFEDEIETSDRRLNASLTLTVDEVSLAECKIPLEEEPVCSPGFEVDVSFSYEQLTVTRRCWFSGLQMREWREELIEVQEEKLAVCYLTGDGHPVMLCCSGIGNNAMIIGGEIEIANYLNPDLIRSKATIYPSFEIKTPGVICSGVRILFGNGLADEEANSKLIRGLSRWLVDIKV